MPTHELITNRNGTISMRELKSGEVMHSSVGPREEATLLYVEQSHLAARLSAHDRASGPLTLYDVGLGAGTNALAALQCWREQARANQAARPLQLYSFENDPSGLRLALENRDKFPFFDGFEQAVETLLERHEWISPNSDVQWKLFAGDFREHVSKCPAPEVVFFDFYSPKAAPDLWSVALFKQLHDICAPAATEVLGTSLYTYSASTRVRVAMLLAGFFVGYGQSTGAKSDTTVASTRLKSLERPLDARWIERLKRSHEPLPHGFGPERTEEVLKKVLEHPQFSISAR